MKQSASWHRPILSGPGESLLLMSGIGFIPWLISDFCFSPFCNPGSFLVFINHLSGDASNSE
jgi:hypothetical protein